MINIVEKNRLWAVRDRAERFGKLFEVEISIARFKLGLILGSLLLLFVFSGVLLQAIDPQVAVVDMGILSLALFGLLIGLAGMLCCLWLQELLWQPFKLFRKQFYAHFNQLTSWQQSIIYFSVYFLLLYALLKALAMVL